MKFKIDVNGKIEEIEATRAGDRLMVSGPDGSVTPWQIETTPNGQILLTRDSDGHRLRVNGAKKGDGRHLWVNGQTYQYKRIDESAASSAAETSGSLSASIPAVVTDILVAEGDLVEAGEKLILLESMKMVIPIQAPTAGTIIAIKCSAGDSVQPGVPLIQIENDE